MNTTNNIDYTALQNHLFTILNNFDRQQFDQFYDKNYIELYEYKKTPAFLAGKFFGKARKTLKKTETKAAFLVAHWAVETFTFALAVYAMFIFGSSITAALLTAFYIYATYALFSLLVNQKR